MLDISRLIYLHGLESTSNSGKARLFREWFPGMFTPDFTGSFDERMSQLHPIISDTTNWTIIGSSFGGLMGAAFTIDHPTQIRKLILLAPALMLDPFASQQRCVVRVVGNRELRERGLVPLQRSRDLDPPAVGHITRAG